MPQFGLTPRRHDLVNGVIVMRGAVTVNDLTRSEGPDSGLQPFSAYGSAPFAFKTCILLADRPGYDRRRRVHACADEVLPSLKLSREESRTPESIWAGDQINAVYNGELLHCCGPRQKFLLRSHGSQERTVFTECLLGQPCLSGRYCLT